MYCCGAIDDSCCDDDSKHFFVDPNNGEVKAPSKATGASASASPTWWTVDSKALLAATSMSSASSTPSASVTQSSASEPTGSTTTSATATGETPAPTSSNTSPLGGEKESKGLSAGAGAGIGIGAAAAIALVGGLVWFLMKRKKKDNPYEAPADQHMAGAGGYTPTSYGSEHKPLNNYYAHESAPTGQVHNAAPQPQELMPEMQGDSHPPVRK